jgi:hypothetical protein
VLTDQLSEIIIGIRKEGLLSRQNLSYTSINGPHGIQLLSHHVGHPSPSLAASGFVGVVELHLDHCQIHARELNVLAKEGMMHNPSLKTLVLSFNSLTAGVEDGQSAGGAVWYKQDTSGLEALASALATDSCVLSRLDVEVCDITKGETDTNGALILARGVCSCTSLESMSFHYLRHDTRAWREGETVIGTGGGHGVQLLTEEAITMAALCGMNGRLVSLDLHEAGMNSSQVALVVSLIGGSFDKNNKTIKTNAADDGEEEGRFITLGAIDSLTSLNLQGNSVVGADWDDDAECMALDVRGLEAVCAMICSPKCKLRSLNLADSAICVRSELCGVASCGADSEPAAMLVDALKTWTRSGIFAKSKIKKGNSRRTMAVPGLKKGNSRRGLLGTASPGNAARRTIVARPVALKAVSAVEEGKAKEDGEEKKEEQKKNFLDLSRNELPPKITQAIQRMCKFAEIELRISAKTVKQQRLYGEGYFGS